MFNFKLSVLHLFILVHFFNEAIDSVEKTLDFVLLRVSAHSLFECKLRLLIEEPTFGLDGEEHKLDFTIDADFDFA